MSMDISGTPLTRRLLLVIMVVAAVYFARPFLVPLAIGGVLAALFLPLCKWLEGRRVAPALAAVMCAVLLLAVVLGVVLLLGWQVSSLAGDINQIRQGIRGMTSDVKGYVYRHFHLSWREQDEIIKQEQPRLGTVVRSVVGSLSSLLYYAGLSLVYVILLLYYRAHVRTFILRLSGDGQRGEVDSVLNNIALVSQQYLLGLAKMIVCLWVMYGAGFSVLGVENALFFAFLCGLLEVVPYIGNLTGTSLTLLVSAAQGASAGTLAGILVTYGCIQFIQGWILEPLIVGPQVRVNPLFTIIALVLGELVWGIPGVFLAIPLLAMFKIVCDHVESLKPVGYLIGEKPGMRNEQGRMARLLQWLRRR